jgi:hypothetical protein
MEPQARLVVVAADERVESAVETQEEKRELALLGLRIEAAAVLETRNRRLARAEHRREMAIAKSEARGGGQDGLGENGTGLGTPLGGWPKR